MADEVIGSNWGFISFRRVLSRFTECVASLSAFQASKFRDRVPSAFVIVERHRRGEETKTNRCRIVENLLNRSWAGEHLSASFACATCVPNLHKTCLRPRSANGKPSFFGRSHVAIFCHGNRVVDGFVSFFFSFFFASRGRQVDATDAADDPRAGAAADAVVVGL